MTSSICDMLLCMSFGKEGGLPTFKILTHHHTYKRISFMSIGTSKHIQFYMFLSKTKFRKGFRKAVFP